MRKFIRHIISLSIAALLVSAALMSISGFAQSTESTQAQFRYDSLREEFTVRGIFHSDAKKFFIGGEVLDIRSQNPFLAIANNLIFTSANGKYQGPQVLETNHIATPIVTQDQQANLTIQSPTNQLLLHSGTTIPVQVVTNNSVSVPRGVTIGDQSGSATDFSIRAPSARGTTFTNLDASPLRISAGIVQLPLPANNTIDGLYWFRTGSQNPVADSVPMCVTVPVTVGYTLDQANKIVARVVSQTNNQIAQPPCPTDTPFLLDAALSLNKIICCNACALGGLGSNYTQQACSSQVQQAMSTQ